MSLPRKLRIAGYLLMMKRLFFRNGEVTISGSLVYESATAIAKVIRDENRGRIGTYSR